MEKSPGKQPGNGIAGPYGSTATPQHELDHPVARRAKALEMAVETVRTVRDFSTYQVVHTAHLYEQFLETGSTPPAPAATTEADDANV